MTAENFLAVAPIVLAVSAAILIAVRVFKRDRQSNRAQARWSAEDKLRNM